MSQAFRRFMPRIYRIPRVNAPTGRLNVLTSNSIPSLLYPCGYFAMISSHPRSEDLSFAEMMSRKSSSRDRQVDAVYAAAPQMLEMAAARAKIALRGSSAPIARPQRFSALSN